MAVSEGPNQAWQAYQTVDPAGWLNVYKTLPLYAALGFIALGVLLLGWGSTPKAVWLLTAPLGALVGKLAVPPALRILQLKLPEGNTQWAPVVLMALVGLGAPPGLIFLAFGIPLGLLGAELAGSKDAALGLGIGFVVAGGSALLLWRRLTAILSSLEGAWLLVLGVLAAFKTLLPFLGEGAQRMPAGAVAASGVIAVLGTAFQLSRPSNEERVRRRAERDVDKKRDRDQGRLEKRWGKNG